MQEAAARQKEEDVKPPLAAQAERQIAGKGSTKQKASALTEKTGSQVAQEGGDELIKRSNLTQRFSRLKGDQRKYAKAERNKVEANEGREMNEGEANALVNRAEQLPVRSTPSEQSTPTIGDANKVDTELGDSGEPKFTDTSNAFSEGRQAERQRAEQKRARQKEEDVKRQQVEQQRQADRQRAEQTRQQQVHCAGLQSTIIRFFSCMQYPPSARSTCTRAH